MVWICDRPRILHFVCTVLGTKQLEQLLWREMPNSPTYPQAYKIFFLQLNNIKKKLKVRYYHLLFNFPCHKVAQKGFHFLLFNEAKWGNIEKNMFQLSHLALQSNSSKCLVWIPHKQLGNYLLSAADSYRNTS